GHVVTVLNGTLVVRTRTTCSRQADRAEARERASAEGVVAVCDGCSPPICEARELPRLGIRRPVVMVAFRVPHAQWIGAGQQPIVIIISIAGHTGAGRVVAPVRHAGEIAVRVVSEAHLLTQSVRYCNRPPDRVVTPPSGQAKSVGPGRHAPELVYKPR